MAKKNGIPFPFGMAQGDEETARFAWGVRSLLWLILTDKKHVVLAEGLGVQDVDAKLTQISGD